MCRREDILERLIQNTVKDEKTGCWIWTGANSGEGNGAGRGYGRISIDGVTMAVHRVSFTHFFGIIPHKKHIDHKCCNRLCWNPEHLDLVTHKENCRRRNERNGK